MELLLKRIAKRDTYTIGHLYINGSKFCDTCEDKDRGLNNSMSIENIKNLKVYGETAIPTGTYTVVLTYSNRFKKVLPLLKDVKGFDGIRIHSGNTAKDSLGCILVGQNKEVGKVLDSRNTFNKLFSELKKASDKGELITITIQ